MSAQEARSAPQGGRERPGRAISRRAAQNAQRRPARPPYAARLDELWRLATAPREPGAPSVASAFAGMGGSLLGYLAAGFRDVLCIEHDPHAAACLRLNFGARVADGDIEDLDVSELGMRPGELGLLDGSPPCQGFSQLRHTGPDPAERNQLYREFARLLRAWQPRAFVMENIAAMTRDRRLFADAHALLRDCGYSVRAAIIPASLFGAATIRKRLIIIGVRDDLGVPATHPAPAARPATVREAWADLPANPGPPPPDVWRCVKPLARMMREGEHGSQVLTARGRPTTAFHNLHRLRWDHPAPALLSVTNTSDVIHPEQTRWLTVAELMRIQAIPDAYRWPEGTTWQDAHRRIGNSVVPLLTWHLGTHLRATVPGMGGTRPQAA